MGLHDRDYAREGNGGYAPYVEPGVATRWLIAINVVLFLLQILTTGRPGLNSTGATEFLYLDTTLVWQGEVWRLLTHGFVHGDLFHLLFNMLGLYFFGRAVEERYGTREFVTFYLIAIFLGAFALMLTHWNQPGRALGASAAVVGVVVLYACNWPHRQVLLFFVIPMPIWLVAALGVAVDALGLMGGGRRGIAGEAHLAGAVFALLYHRQQWRFSDLWQSFQEWRHRKSGPKLRVYREEPEEPRHKLTAALSEDEQLEAKVDAVLEKLSRVGQDGLTEQDKAILQKASEVFRKRRG